MTDAEFWETERQLWLGGSEAFRRFYFPSRAISPFASASSLRTSPRLEERPPATGRSSLAT